LSEEYVSVPKSLLEEILKEVEETLKEYRSSGKRRKGSLEESFQSSQA
jgi:ABC-type Fe3+-citrate transport system substrate-binding protein